MKLPKYNSEKFLKATIADSMFKDANQFLWRVHFLLRTSDLTDRNWYSKIYVDLLMSIESDLKGLIICLSKDSESPEEAYRVARKKGHDIKLLYNEVESRAKNRLKLLPIKTKEKLLNDFTTLNVNNRYDLVTFYDIRNDMEKLNFKDNSIKVLLGEESILELEKLAIDLHQILISARKKMPLIAMTGKSVGNYHKRIQEFFDNLKKL